MQAFPVRANLAAAPLVYWFILLLIKHVLADFFWQPAWMAAAKDQRAGWAKPLLMHCAIHGVSTTALLIVLQPHLWVLGLLDFTTHLFIDRAKGYILALRKITSNDRPFWALLGIDQALHHLTGFFIAVIVAVNTTP